MKRFTLVFSGLSLTLPNFGREVRIAALCVANSAGNVVTLKVLNGTGDTAFFSIASSTVNGTLFAPTFDTSGNSGPLPIDLKIEETDTVILSSAGAFDSVVVVSYEETKGG